MVVSQRFGRTQGGTAVKDHSGTSGRFFRRTTLAVAVLFSACGPEATRTVGGSRLTTFWPDTGTSAPHPAWDVSRRTTAMNAYALSGSTLLPGTLDTSGTFQIVGVPQGSYLLEFINAYGVHHFFETDSSTVDLGWDALGRPDLQTTDVSTTTKFQLDALELTGSSDAFEMTSSNASVSEVLAQPGDVPEGITSFAQSFDWSLRPTYLVDSARADLVFVHQRSTRTDAASGLAYRAASGWGQLPPGFAVTSGAAQSVEVSLTAASQSGLLSTHWSPSSFEGCVTDWPAGAAVLESTSSTWRRWLTSSTATPCPIRPRSFST
jgi:hypothetical protein